MRRKAFCLCTLVAGGGEEREEERGGEGGEVGGEGKGFCFGGCLSVWWVTGGKREGGGREVAVHHH